MDNGIIQRSEKLNALLQRQGISVDSLQIITDVLSYPAYKLETSNGSDYYDNQKMSQLLDALFLMTEKIQSTHTDLPIPERIQAILAEGTEEFPCNFFKAPPLEEGTTIYPDERLSGRTAFGLLCTDNGANCIGFSEASCLLLSLQGYEAYPVISKLLKSTQNACHYVTVVKNDNGEIQVIDPERLRSCSEPEKGWQLEGYQCSIRYAVPPEKFCREKVGTDGLGPHFTDLEASGEIMPVRPIEHLSEYCNEKGRLTIKANEITPGTLTAYKQALSTTLEPVFYQCREMNKPIEKAAVA